jgi:hypothetical protein
MPPLVLNTSLTLFTAFSEREDDHGSRDYAAGIAHATSVGFDRQDVRQWNRPGGN